MVFRACRDDGGRVFFHNKLLGHLKGGGGELDGIIILIPRQSRYCQLEGAVTDKIAIHGPGVVAGKVSGIGHSKSLRGFLDINYITGIRIFLGDGIVYRPRESFVTLPQIKGSAIGEMVKGYPLRDKALIGRAILPGISIQFGRRTISQLYRLQICDHTFRDITLNNIVRLRRKDILLHRNLSSIQDNTLNHIFLLGRFHFAKDVPQFGNSTPYRNSRNR